MTWCGDTYVPLPETLNAIPAATTTITTTKTSITTETSTSTTANSAPSSSQLSNTPTCYSADAQGIIFAPLSEQDVLSSNTLRIYGPLAGTGDENPSPLGATIAQANLLPNALQFVKAIKSLGVPIVSLVIRGDEADLYAQSGTRITYVLGHEEVTAQVAEAAFPSLNLNDGSLEYVDLRFEGKAYFKKVGDTEATAATSTGSGQ